MRLVEIQNLRRLADTIYHHLGFRPEDFALVGDWIAAARAGVGNPVTCYHCGVPMGVGEPTITGPKPFQGDESAPVVMVRWHPGCYPDPLSPAMEAELRKEMWFAFARDRAARERSAMTVGRGDP